MPRNGRGFISHGGAGTCSAKASLSKDARGVKLIDHFFFCKLPAVPVCLLFFFVLETDFLQLPVVVVGPGIVYS